MKTMPVRIGMDTAKSAFQLHGVDENEEVVLRRQLRRAEMIRYFEKLPPALIAIESCGSSHQWARLLQSFGHEVKLIPPQYVKAYVKICSPDHNFTYGRTYSGDISRTSCPCAANKRPR